jgi:hypothetical protein
MLPEEHQNKMEQILNRYIKMVKADFQPGGKGWEARSPFLHMIQGKKDEQFPSIVVRYILLLPNQ